VGAFFLGAAGKGRAEQRSRQARRSGVAREEVRQDWSVFEERAAVARNGARCFALRGVSLGPAKTLRQFELAHG
jgi:hypothetical protein